MIRKTKKNVAILKWFSFAMFLIGFVILICFAKCASEGLIESIFWGVAGSFALPAMWLFWLMAFAAFADIEDEMKEKRNKK